MLERLLKRIARSIDRYLNKRKVRDRVTQNNDLAFPGLFDGETPISTIVREVGNELGKYGPLTVRDILSVLEWRFPKTLAAQRNARWRINALRHSKWVAVGRLYVSPVLCASGVETVYCDRKLLDRDIDGRTLVPEMFKGMLMLEGLVVPEPGCAGKTYCTWGVVNMPSGMSYRLGLTRGKLYGINITPVEGNSGLDFKYDDQLVLEG